MLFNHEQELNKGQLEGEMELALVKAEQERVDALATQEAELDKQRLLELTKAEQELKKQADRQAANLKKETELALAETNANASAAHKTA